MQRVGSFALIVFEIAILSALILATRCANYQDVFVAGNVYFADADCYARMTRAQMVSGKAGARSFGIMRLRIFRKERRRTRLRRWTISSSDYRFS